jgi:hypothetical protein
MASSEANLSWKYEVVLEDLASTTVVDVKNFFEKYFQDKAWPQSAKDLADGFKQTQDQISTRGSTILPSKADVVQEIMNYCNSFPSARNIFNASSDQPVDDCEEGESPDLYLIHAQSQRTELLWSWSDVQVLGQVITVDNEQSRQVRLQFCMHAWRVFNNHPTRCFLHGFFVCGSQVEL